MKRYGIEWENDGEQCFGVRGRYHPVTWPFGTIHQCVVDVDSPSAHPWRGHIHICLPPQKTKFAAMKRAVQWIDDYEKRGPLGAEKTIKQVLRDWPRLFKDRLDVLDQLFFVGGAGYDWLDGAIIDSHQLTTAEAAAARRARKRADARNEVIEWRIAERLMGIETPPAVEPRRAFYPVTEHSCVVRVPDDVRPDWLKVAYEAAVAYEAVVTLRTSTLVADLERRFPGRVP